MSFYVTLPSNTLSDAKNIQSNYNTILKRPINLNGEFEVALTEISFSTKYQVNYGKIEYLDFSENNLPTRKISLELNYENRVLNLAESLNNSIKEKSVEEEFSFRYKLAWDTSKEIVDNLHQLKQTKNIVFVLIKKNYVEVVDIQNQILWGNNEYENFRYKFTDRSRLPSGYNYIFIKVPEIASLSIEDDLELKQDILQTIKKKIENEFIPVFLFEGQKLKLIYSDQVKIIGNFSMILSGKNETNFLGGTSLRLLNELSIINYAAVYTNIIEEQFFGDSLVPILRCVNLPNSQNENIIIYFDNPLYVPVNKSIINTINIKIADLQGNLILFKDFFSFVIVTLHFRKVKNA